MLNQRSANRRVFGVAAARDAADRGVGDLRKGPGARICEA